MRSFNSWFTSKKAIKNGDEPEGEASEELPTTENVDDIPIYDAIQTTVNGEERLPEQEQKNWLCRLFNLLMRPFKKNGDVDEFQEQKSWPSRLQSWILVNRTTDEKKNNTSVVVPVSVSVDDDYIKDIDKSRRYLRILLHQHNCAVDIIRLAWSEAATFDVVTKTGGPNGSVRFGEEHAYCCASGLQNCLDLCAKVKTDIPGNRISYADLYQLAGVVAVESIGGPTVPFIPGRKDCKACAISELLPNPRSSADDLKRISARMGLEARDIVALSMFHMERSRLEDFLSRGSPAPARAVFDNAFFRDLLKNQGSLDLESQKSQKALVTDPELRSYVTLYAKDLDAFFRDYSSSHQRFSELGFTVNQVQSGWNRCNVMVRMARKAKDVLLVVVILVLVAGMVVGPRRRITVEI
ncbi:hypothetical protein QYF36_016429 [Acer negundo]|nr:hypothetical protein QYF36_016429 [Acer negundo]